MNDDSFEKLPSISLFGIQHAIWKVGATPEALIDSKLRLKKALRTELNIELPTVNIEVERRRWGADQAEVMDQLRRDQWLILRTVLHPTRPQWAVRSGARITGSGSFMDQGGGNLAGALILSMLGFVAGMSPAPWRFIRKRLALKMI